MLTNLDGIPHVGDHVDSSYEDDRWTRIGGGATRASTWYLGDDPCGPMLYLLDSPPPPAEGSSLDPIHSHKTDQMRIVWEGTLTMGRTPLPPGHVRVQAADGYYGPGKGSPTGSKQVLIFADRRGAIPDYAREEDTNDPRGQGVIKMMNEALVGHVPEPGDPRAARPYRSSLANSMDLKPHAGHVDTSFDDPSWTEIAGVRCALWCLSDDPRGPAVVLIDVPAGAAPVPARKYGCDHVRIVLRGSCEIGGTTYTTGGVRGQDADTFFGPEVTGPGGSRQCILVAHRDAWHATYADPNADRSTDWMAAVDDVLGRVAMPV